MIFQQMATQAIQLEKAACEMVMKIQHGTVRDHDASIPQKDIADHMKEGTLHRSIGTCDGIPVGFACAQLTAWHSGDALLEYSSRTQRRNAKGLFHFLLGIGPEFPLPMCVHPIVLLKHVLAARVHDVRRLITVGSAAEASIKEVCPEDDAAWGLAVRKVIEHGVDFSAGWPFGCFKIEERSDGAVILHPESGQEASLKQQFPTSCHVHNGMRKVFINFSFARTPLAKRPEPLAG